MKHFARGNIAAGLVTAVVIFGCKPRLENSKALDAGAGSGEFVSWVDQQPITDWTAEIKKRDKAIYDYIRINDAATSAKFGFKNNQTPAIAWKWFENNPVGFGGVPFVLWKTIALLEDSDSYYRGLADKAKSVANGSSYYTGVTSYFGAPTPSFTADEVGALRAVAKLWHQPSTGSGQKNLDHIGVLPHPDNYIKSNDPYSASFTVVKDPGRQTALLPYGMGFESTPESFPTASKAKLLKELSGKVSGFAQVKTKLAINKFVWDKLGYNEGDDDKPETFGHPTKYDNVFFACAGCHIGRVVTEDGGVKYLYGAPNTEIEAQYYSQILRDTVGLLVLKGFDTNAKTFQGKNEIEPNKVAIVALAKVMIMTVMVSPEKFYGSDEVSERRAYHQAMQLLDNFGGVVKELIGTGVKTHYIYNVVAGGNYQGSGTPDLLNNRVGQMDAFGIASGLLAIHTMRPTVMKGSKTLAPGFQDLAHRIYPDSPFFTGFDGLGSPETLKGMSAQDLRANNDAELFEKIGQQIRANVPSWRPLGPAPIDIKNLNWSKDRKLANWDGNQGASARTLSSGTSATGDPRKVNVRIHEAQNPFIENLPPPPYPFKVDVVKAKDGAKLFSASCAGCHKPDNETIYSAQSLGTDKWRSMTNTAVTRHGLTALVFEACFYYMRNNPVDVTGTSGKPGTDRDWCLPKNLQGKWGQNLADFDNLQKMTKEQYQILMDDYFKDTPKRVENGENGYKADMLHGIWSNAPYLHNGSVPTLAQLVCGNTRPEKFIRGNINYDQDGVGFVWWEKPKMYNKYDMSNTKEFVTNKQGWSNTGHNFGKDYCGAVGALGADATHDQIAKALKASPELSNLLEYMKTL